MPSKCLKKQRYAYYLYALTLLVGITEESLATYNGLGGTYAGNWSAFTLSTSLPGPNQTNTFSSNLTVNSGTADLSGSTNNITAGGLTVTGLFSSADLSGSTNQINGGLSVTNGGAVFLGNSSPAAATNSTIDSLTLDNGILLVGGGASTTVTGTFTWTSGLMEVGLVNRSTGTTTFGSLDVSASAPRMLAVIDLTFDATANSPIKVFDAIGVTQSQVDPILAICASPFVEVDYSAGNGGLTVSGTGVYINLKPASTVFNTEEANAATSAIESARSSVQSAQVQSTLNGFRSSPFVMAQTRSKMAQAFRSNSDDPFEAAVTAFTEADDSIKSIKFKGDYRTWITPFATNVQNNGVGTQNNAFTLKQYGLLMGASHFVKKFEINVTGIIGYGGSKTRLPYQAKSGGTSKSYITGVNLEKTFNNGIEVISSFYGILFKSRQDRQSNPDKYNSFVAKSKFNTLSFSNQTELGYVYKLVQGYSVRPAIGGQIGICKRSGFTEYNIPLAYAQRYKAQVSKGGEIYTGLGVRKKWSGDHLEGKVTVKYNIGRQTGNGKSSTTVYGATIPTGISFSSSKPGLTTQNINIYGSVLDKESNWKVSPGGTITIQKNQRSYTGLVKAEYRW